MRHAPNTSSFSVLVELWTFTQDEAELQILRAFDSPLVPRRSDLRAVTWAGGDSLRSRPHDIIDYVSRLKMAPLNESFLRFAFQAYSLSNTELVLTGIEFRLRISPTSAKWESPYGHQARNPAGERMRMFHESLERSLKRNAVYSCPTVLEVALAFAGQVAREQFYPRFAPILAEALTPASTINLLGCAYMSGDAEFGLFERLAPWPKTYPSLQSHLDKLHPIVIGPVRLCESLSNSIRGVCGNASVAWWQSKGDLGVLWLPERVLDDEKVAAATSRFLVEKSEHTQAARADQEPQIGDFRFGSALFHTFRRYRQLAEEGLLPSADTEHMYFPLIAVEYCRVIGVDPEDMLVTGAPSFWVQEVQSRISDLFGQFPEGTPIHKRIYLVHEQVYREKYGSIPGLFKPFWAHMRKTYFEERKT